jgi:ppGpp synthetase/RelA/SpoT-type nucleotidyltranferase
MEKTGVKDDKAQELVNEYNDKRSLFEEYTKTIRLLLENLLKKHQIQFQTIQFRTKEVPNFYEKLLRKKELQSKNLFEMTDLSGCRVIFYFEETIEQFTEVLYKEFEVVDYEDKFSPNEYNARNIVLQLKENRFNLPEYSEFKGLLCEIQLTTVLFHAWAEIQHDIIYKPNKELLEFDKPAFDNIDNYFKEIMEKYLKEASRGFSFIFYEFNKIRRGQFIISPTTIDAMSKSASNNEIYSFLKLLTDYVAKYSHKLPGEYKLVDALETTLNSAEKNPVVDRKTIFGNLKGITYLDIADVVLDILDRYYDVSNNLLLLIKLGKQKELRKKCEETLQRTVTYKIAIVNKYGFSVQKIVLDYVSEQKPEYLLENLDLILASIKPIASLECEDVSMDSSETVTFKRGCLKPSLILEGIRTRYFELTKNLLQLVNKDVDRQKVLSAMFSIANAPHSQKLSDETIVLLSANIVKIIDFLITYYDTVTNVIKKDIQGFVFMLERQDFKDRFVNLTKLKEKIDQDTNYARFRIFYGDNLGFFPNFDFKATEEFRNQKIDEFVQQINEPNLENWFNLFRELLASYQTGIELMYFSIFLRKIGQLKPEIAFKILTAEEFAPFLSAILSGLIESSEQEKAKKLLSEYSNQETKRFATIQALFSKKDYDDGLFKEIYPNLLETTDTAVLLMLLQTIVSNYNKHNDHKEEVTSIINKLTKLNFFSWSFVYYMAKDYWKEMSDDNAIAILENLKNHDNISYEDDGMLSLIGEKNPKAVISFFHDRVEFAKAKKISDPIPYEFLELGKSLSKNYKEILPEIIKWFSEEDQLENWYASKLIENIFPLFGPDLEHFLLVLVQKNDTKNLEVVLRILEGYEGQFFLHNVVKEIIKLYTEDEPLRIKLYRILSGVEGAVMGDYGYLDAYKLKKDQIKDWLNDSDTKVKEFAAGFVKHLNELINHEKERADKEVAFRKKAFDIERI